MSCFELPSDIVKTKYLKTVRYYHTSSQIIAAAEYFNAWPTARIHFQWFKVQNWHRIILTRRESQKYLFGTRYRLERGTSWSKLLSRHSFVGLWLHGKHSFVNFAIHIFLIKNFIPDSMVHQKITSSNKKITASLSTPISDSISIELVNTSIKRSLYSLPNMNVTQHLKRVPLQPETLNWCCTTQTESTRFLPNMEC